MSLKPLLLLCGVVLACAASSGGIQSQRLPDGTIHLTCQTSLQKCLDGANQLCKGNSYDILRARDQRDRLGGELGQSNVEVRSSEALVRCAGTKEPPPSPPAPEPTWKLPPPASAPPAPLPPAAPERSCVPGATQSCVGPGACQGGQACLPSGEGFAPCDCGPATRP